MQDGELVRWLKAVGDQVAQDEPIAEIEAAKTTVELPAPASGRISELLVSEGETVRVRAHIATIVS